MKKGRLMFLAARDLKFKAVLAVFGVLTQNRVKTKKAKTVFFRGHLGKQDGSSSRPVVKRKIFRFNLRYKVVLAGKIRERNYTARCEGRLDITPKPMM